MNKAEFTSAVADDAEMSKADAGRAVDAMIEVIKKALKKGDTVTLVGFGTFSVRKRAARQGRNPQTGDTIKIKASKNPAFKAGKALKDAVTERLPWEGVLSSAVERLPYKERVGGSIPSAPTSIAGTQRRLYHDRLRGVVVQLVRMLACHAGGRGFESRPLRH